MSDDSDNPFLTIDETAELLRVNRRTLDNLRWQDAGPPFRRHGGRIVYHRNEVLAWSEQRRARTATEPSDQPLAARNRHAQPRPAPARLPQGSRSNVSMEHQP
jgi:hypothetical protein